MLLTLFTLCEYIPISGDNFCFWLLGLIAAAFLLVNWR